MFNMIFLRATHIPAGDMKLIKNGFNLIQAATMTSRSTRGEPLKLSPPFPYEQKKLWYYHKFLDPTMLRLSNENCRVIVVEGPVGAGKSAFCQALADEFEMKYFPQPTMDQFYILPSGYDLRQHDDEVPVDVRTYDHKNFCVNPFTFKAALLQCDLLYLQFFQYLNAMCHLYNTGQGAVLERSHYSGHVFLKALVENKYVNPIYLQAYLTIQKNLSNLFPKPHLIVYLDMPVPVVQERIKTRNYSYEQNSPALTSQFLASYEKFMKEDYLKEARKTSEILIYDWSDGGNIDVVIDDIENIDFDFMRGDKRFLSWRVNRIKLELTRRKVTNQPYIYRRYFEYPWFNIEEAYNHQKKSILSWNNILAKLPEAKFDIGYNYHMGDSIFKILFGVKKEKFRLQRPYLYMIPYEE